MRKITIGLLAATGMVLSAGAVAAQDTGLYGSVNIGTTSVKDVDIEYYDIGGAFGGTGTRDSIEGTYHIKRGTAFRISLGYDFGAVRSDVEISYGRNDVEGLSLTSVNGGAVPALTPADYDDICDYLEVDNCSGSGNRINFSGEGVRQATAMASVWFDLPVATQFSPYVGGGIGINGFETGGEGDATFAWQVGAGMAFNVTPNLAITADYRYRRAGSSEIVWDTDSGFNVGPIRTQTLSVGVRLRF